MKVGIVGAGICGLAAARTLKSAGHELVVFEKHTSVGGRVSTRQQDGFLWDSGATSIAPRGKKIEPVMLQELSTLDLIKIEKPIYVHKGLRVSPGHAAGATRYTYKQGNQRLAELLAEGIDVRLSTPVDSIDTVGKHYQILGEEFDALILTPPVPQTALLLWSLGETRPMTQVCYRHCISVLLGFKTPLPPTNYHALLDAEQVHPLTWICLESTKSPGRAPDGCSAITAQMNAAHSLSHFDLEDEILVGQVAGYLKRLYGEEFGEPHISKVKRWKYSQPESYATFDHVNRKGSRLLVASDGLLGGHVEDAYEIGTRTAALLVEED